MKKFKAKLLRENDIEEGAIYIIDLSSYPNQYVKIAKEFRFSKMISSEDRIMITGHPIKINDPFVILRIEVFNNPNFSSKGYKVRILYESEYHDMLFYKSDFKLLKRFTESDA